MDEKLHNGSVNQKPIIMVIDDDLKLLKLLKEYLPGFGFEVETFPHPQQGIEALRNKSFNALTLDLMLPDKDGLTVCQEVRSFSSIPILMLTARGDITDRVTGLELGADDYLPKPFEPRELVARLKALIRRNEKPQKSATFEVLHFDSLIIDPSKRKVIKKNVELDFSTAEFDLLYLVAKSPGKAFSRDDIVDALHGEDWVSYVRAVDVTISRIRQKLEEDPKHPTYIKTIWGKGYAFIGEPKK